MKMPFKINTIRLKLQNKNSKLLKLLFSTNTKQFSYSNDNFLSLDETFDVITVKGADLKFHGDSYTADSWYPGYRWRACVCSVCGSHMGWYILYLLLKGLKYTIFEHSRCTLNFESSKQNFIGIVLDYTICSRYVDRCDKTLEHKRALD
jgi:hypothetical protein